MNTEIQHTLQHDVSEKLAKLKKKKIQMVSYSLNLLTKLTLLVLYMILTTPASIQNNDYLMYVSNNKQDNQYAVQVFTPLMNIEGSTVKTHPFVPGVVTVSNVSDGPGRV